MMKTVDGLLEQGWAVTVVAQVCEIPAHPGLSFIKIPTPTRPFLIAFPSFAVCAGFVLRFSSVPRGAIVAQGAIVLNRVDIVNVQFCHAGFIRQRLVRKSRPGPLYELSARISQRLSLALERWCYRPGRLKRMTTVSPLVKRELLHHYDLRGINVEVIPNGVDPQQFRPDPDVRSDERERLGLLPEEPVALFVGGDWQRKGLAIAIEAAAVAGWKLLVAGRGDAAAWMEFASRHDAAVAFLGHLPDPSRLFGAADVFMLPSSYEGFALVVIEAASAGLTVLVTAATGASELVSSGGGRILEPNAAAFAAELERLAATPGLLAESGARARAAAQRYAWPHVIDAYARAYDMGAR